MRYFDNPVAVDDNLPPLLLIPPLYITDKKNTMSDIIQLLPDSVANQIAAGEVIQRPASVIKELMENAIDANAKSIQLLIIDAGRTSMQVIDDGKGMTETDARLAFERHATSKIKNADDLFSLQTMGFRGEALASIAAVSQVQLKTKQENEELGTFLAISGSRVVKQEPCSCPTGSNFKIENLFYNVPARRKFLKSNTTELNNIINAFQRIALVYPEIKFTLHSNNTELFNLKPSNLRQRIVDIFGIKLNQDLLPFEVNTSICKVKGYVGKPESSKKKNPLQYFFVNGRYMRHPYFHKAVMNTYERLIPQGGQIPYFIYFEMEPDKIDVNIHPSKTEIKFDNEQAIWQILSAAVKNAIGQFGGIPTIDFDTADRPDIPTFNPGANNDIAAPQVKYNPNYNPFQTPSGKTAKKVPENWEQLFMSKPQVNRPNELFQGTENDIIAEKSPVHYQYKGKYIMTAVKSGLMIIDQHRAHVRILFEKYSRQLEKKRPQSQKMLFPQRVHFSANDHIFFEKLIPGLQLAGFEISSLGGNDYSINSVPGGTENIDIARLLQNIIDETKENFSNILEDMQNSLSLSLARNSAITQGQVLTNGEMEGLVNDLFACKTVNYTPDGKRILCILKQEEIEKMLG